MNWIVTELFYPDEVSSALVMTEIAEEIAKSEKVKVICGPMGYEKSYKAQHRMLSDKIIINRVNIVELNKNKLITRVFRFVLLSIKMSIKVLINVKKGDNLLLVTNPAFLILTVSVIKLFKKFNLAILIHDVFPENLIPGNILHLHSWKYNLIKSVYDSAYRKADKIIVLGTDMEQLMLKKLRYNIPPIEIITNWADDDTFPLKNFNKSQYLGIDVTDKIVISFAGNFGRLQGLLEFLSAFNEASNPNLLLVLIGDGAFKSQIETYIEIEKMDNVVLLGSKPRAEQNLFLNACDIGLITLKKGMKGLGVPSKTYNIMAAGKPLLYVGDNQSEIDNYIHEYLCGWSFSIDNRNMLLDFLSNLSLNNKPELLLAGENSLKAANKFYRKKTVLKKFSDTIC